MVIKQCPPKSGRKRSSHGRNTQARAQSSAVGPPAPEAVQTAGFATPRGVPRISVDDLLLEDGPPSSSFTRAAETLFLSFSQNGAVILEPARHDAALLCRTLESARLYFRRRADASSSSLASSSQLETPEWDDGGGFYSAPSKDLYFYKAGRSLNEGINDSCPPGFSEAFKYMGRVSRSVMSALARHLRLRCDFFSGLLDDCPLPIGEVSSSVLATACQRSQPPQDGQARMIPDATETEKGLLMLVTADFPGLQVCNPEGVWSPADQGVPPGSLLLLAGRCLHRATGGLCPASTYRVLPPASPGGLTAPNRCSLSFRLMPRPAAVIDCSSLAHAGHAVPASMRETVYAGAFIDALNASSADVGAAEKESSLAVSCKLEKSSLASMVSDPVSGSLLEDAMVAQCGHSFGGATLARVMESMVCPYCMAPVDVMALIPNLAVRSVASCFGKGPSHHTGLGVKAPKRKREKEHHGEGKLLLDGSTPHPVKRRPKPDDSAQLGSPDAEGGGRLRGVQFPFSVDEKVLIKGNKRTPEKFFGKEAVITSQCLNGWYLVRILDSGESVRLQYRSLQKCDGTAVQAKAEPHQRTDTAEPQADAGGEGVATSGDKSWWVAGERRMMGEMSALLQADDDSDHPPSFPDDALLPPNPSGGTPLSPSLLGQSLMLSPPSSHLALLSPSPQMGRPSGGGGVESGEYGCEGSVGAGLSPPLQGASLAKGTQALIAAAAAVEAECRGEAGGSGATGACATGSVGATGDGGGGAPHGASYDGRIPAAAAAAAPASGGYGSAGGSKQHGGLRLSSGSQSNQGLGRMGSADRQSGADRQGGADRCLSDQQGPLPLWMSPITATTILHQAISDAGGGSGEQGGGLGVLNDQAG
ncbi:hypothetical protein CLOM_g24423 [Closterium sp. NIES-68]|nr:hypothetical protein CLOM_g24423 [Closterium sp. NIES-68]